MSNHYTLGEIAKHIDAEVYGDPNLVITGLGSLTNASAGQLTFIDAQDLAEKIASATASAYIVKTRPEIAANLLVLANTRLGFAKAAELFDTKASYLTGIHPSAVIDPSAKLADSVVVGPNVTIGQECVIGANSIIKANAVICAKTTMGTDCIIHQGAIIGSDGFGNAQADGKWYKIPQIGGVQIANHVEIGANTTIDCGTIGDTIIEEGVRIDNLVHIAHNVHIGAHTAIAAHAAIAGSVTVGRHCMLGGKSGIANHLTLCDGVMLTGTAFVTNSIKKPGVYSSGTGLMENNLWRRAVVRLRGLDALAKVVRKLEKKCLKEQ
jgi:UDP-3-O-[3-hydroxymyristoyl] glucosamine N-acyltransferase